MVREAHSELKPKLLPLLKAKSYEVRVVATSFVFPIIAYMRSVVMNTAQWRYQSVCASHYLRNVLYEY